MTRQEAGGTMVYDEASIEAIVTPYVGATGGLIVALRAVQSGLGHVPAESFAVIARTFNITQAEVRGVVSFYDDFKSEPVAKTVVRICQAEACQSVGSHALTKRISETLGLALGETSADRSVGLEPVYCLGLCSCGPSMMVGDKLYGRAEGRRLDVILSSIAPVKH
jgi:formate dehydrogenase subunit gamma